LPRTPTPQTPWTEGRLFSTLNRLYCHWTRLANLIALFEVLQLVN